LTKREVTVELLERVDALSVKRRLTDDMLAASGLNWTVSRRPNEGTRTS